MLSSSSDPDTDLDGPGCICIATPIQLLQLCIPRRDSPPACLPARPSLAPKHHGTGRHITSARHPPTFTDRRPPATDSFAVRPSVSRPQLNGPPPVARPHPLRRSRQPTDQPTTALQPPPPPPPQPPPPLPQKTKPSVLPPLDETTLQTNNTTRGFANSTHRRYRFAFHLQPSFPSSNRPSPTPTTLLWRPPPSTLTNTMISLWPWRVRRPLPHFPILPDIRTGTFANLSPASATERRGLAGRV